MAAVGVNIRGELPVGNKNGMRQYPRTERNEEARQLRQKKQWSWATRTTPTSAHLLPACRSKTSLCLHNLAKALKSKGSKILSLNPQPVEYRFVLTPTTHPQLDDRYPSREIRSASAE